jgi:pyruvate formate lyase activating enzyme
MKDFLRFVLISILLFTAIAVCCHPTGIIASQPSKEALFYKKLGNQAVACQLCPRLCNILPGRRGFCAVRENQGGVLYTLSYAKPVAIHLDPIEKKPLFHYLPGTSAFSVATAGCNLRCKFCQNWEISQMKPEDVDYLPLLPLELVQKAKESGALTIAYTYSEPTIFFEYMLEIAKLAHENGIRNVMHSSGYINEEPLKALAKYLDAANIDLKGFSDEYYAKLSEGTLAPVLNSLKILKDAKVHLEITNLILPGYNDDPDLIKQMCLWIKDNLGTDTPLHFSRFFPTYKLASLNPTPVESLEKARQIALNVGLKYVYIGNVAGLQAENTNCPECKQVVIERKGYFVVKNNLVDGKCKFCQTNIAGIWK